MSMRITFLKHLVTDKIKEPRRTSHGHLLHDLIDIIVIGLCTIICGGKTYNDMEDFGRAREQWLGTFLTLRNGIPSNDTFRRCFERLESEELARCLYEWLKMFREERSVIAIDGKTICGSGSDDKAAVHIVSAFVAKNHLTLGEVCVKAKSNEITAVPELLELIDVRGAIVTADAMSCQKAIVEKLITKKADYVICLKGNQGTLHFDSDWYIRSGAVDDLPYIQVMDKGHGRIEKRTYRLVTDLTWLGQVKDWAGLKAIGVVDSEVTKKGKTVTERRYFITSLTDLEEFGHAVRQHWGIENNLHWSLDVVFREDACRAKKGNSARNLNVLRKTALSLLANTIIGKCNSNARKMNCAAMDFRVLQKILMNSGE